MQKHPPSKGPSTLQHPSSKNPSRLLHKSCKPKSKMPSMGDHVNLQTHQSACMPSNDTSAIATPHSFFSCRHKDFRHIKQGCQSLASSPNTARTLQQKDNFFPQIDHKFNKILSLYKGQLSLYTTGRLRYPSSYLRSAPSQL